MAKTTSELAVRVDVQVGEVTLDTVIGEHTEYYGPDDEPSRKPYTLRDLLVKEFLRKMLTEGGMHSLRTTIEQIRREVVREMVEQTVREILAGPFQPTSAYGENTGEPTTLRAMIATQAAAALKVRTDSSYGRRESVVEKIVREETGSVLAKELKAALEAERAKVVALMQSEGAKLIAQMLTAGVPGGRG